MTFLCRIDITGDLEGVRIFYRRWKTDALRETFVLSREYVGAIRVPRPSSRPFVRDVRPSAPTGGVLCLFSNDTAGRTDAETCRVLRLTIGQTERGRVITTRVGRDRISDDRQEAPGQWKSSSATQRQRRDGGVRAGKPLRPPSVQRNVGVRVFEIFRSSSSPHPQERGPEFTRHDRCRNTFTRPLPRALALRVRRRKTVEIFFLKISLVSTLFLSSCSRPFRVPSTAWRFHHQQAPST